MQIGTINDSMRILKYFIKNAFLFGLTILLTYPVGRVVHFFMCELNQCGSSWIASVDFSPAVAMFIAFPFSFSLVFTLFGGRFKYFWIVGASVGIFVVFHFYEEWGFIKLFIQLILLPLIFGWLLGFLIQKLLPR